MSVNKAFFVTSFSAKIVCQEYSCGPVKVSILLCLLSVRSP